MQGGIPKLIEKIKRNSLFLQNITYLSFLEAVNVLVPIITLPYLLLVLGKEVYGLVIFVQATLYYLVLVQNFGLNTLAVKEVSIARNSKKSLNRIISNVLTIKLLLFIGLLIAVSIAIQLVPKLKEFELLIYLSMWTCLFDFIFPKWYFQGIEKMKYITYINVISKIIIIVLLFSIVKSEKDFLLVPTIYGIGALIAGISSLIIIFKYHNIKFLFSGFKEIRALIKRSFTFFVSDLSVSIFANSNKVIIGTFLGMTAVSYYDLSEKIVATFKNIPLNIVRDSIYPRVAQSKNIQIVKNISLIMGSYAVVIVLLIFLLAPFIVALLGGNEMKESINVLRLLSVTIFTTHISNYFITVGLWSLGYEKIFRNLMIQATLIFLLFFGILWLLDMINLYTLTGLPILVDIYLVIHTYLIYKKKGLFDNEKH